MFQYRVGTYDAIAKLPNVDFELWHGKDVVNSKKKNFKGKVGFRHKQLNEFRIPFKTNNGSGKMPIYPFLFFKLIRYKPDVILTEGASNLWAASIAFIYSKMFGKKIIWWTLGTLAGRKHRGLRSLIQKWIGCLERHVDAVFAYSNQAKEYLLDEGVNEEKIFVGVNVIDTSRRINEAKECSNADKENGFNVVFVGSVNKTKKLEVLVDAVADLSKEYGDVKLHIIGDGNYLDTIKKYTEGYKIVNATFHGRITEGLGILLSRYQVMVLPGLGGLAIVDGMACSLPIISGPADGTELDLIEDGENGFVTREINKDYIKGKLRYLHDNSERTKEMGERSFEKITGQYSFENYLKKFEECLVFVESKK
jgi:glycosyltransferase involved in cell wall biosynthesis